MQLESNHVIAPRDHLSFRSMFLHAWDLCDDGIDNVMGELRQVGLTTMCMAGTYHSGWFIHPHNSRHRAFMTEGSVCYFHPSSSLYKNTRLRPRLSTISKEKDWFAEAGKRLEKHDLNLVSWTVGTHNSHLGTEYPELTQQNVYGDRLPHALCPANHDVKEYLLALCRDLATNYPMWGLQLESFGWMGFSHGHHHERDLVGLSSLEKEFMGLCVCPACTQKATSAGVDIQATRQFIKEMLDAAFREAPDRPAGHPISMHEAEAKSAALGKFNLWRKSYVNSLIADIQSQSLKGTNCRLLLQTPFDPALTGVADGFGCGAYQQSPEETLRICSQASVALPAGWNGILQCFIQLGMGIPKNEEQLRAIITSVRNGGCNGINFYNRSESPPKMLNWLSRIMPVFH
jgi:hypothetical protein